MIDSFDTRPTLHLLSMLRNCIKCKRLVSMWPDVIPLN